MSHEKQEERGQLNMIQDTVKDKLDAMRGLSSEDILGALGLERKRTALDVILPAAGIFVAGVAIGTGVALLLAPKSGREMRRELKGKANELTQRIGATAEEIAQEVRGSLTHEDKDDQVAMGLDNGTRTERKPGDSTRAAAAPK